jgi:hypothetical protein
MWKSINVNYRVLPNPARDVAVMASLMEAASEAQAWHECWVVQWKVQ